MAEITAELVKSLREKTGQGMMECKKALTETKGDVEAAIDLLRKRGMAKATTKVDRATKEGRVVIVSAPGSATMVEVVCETDFCSRNDEFGKMAQHVAELAAAEPAGDIPATAAMTAVVQACFNKIGENMRYSRGAKVAAERVGAYLHHNGKVGVLVGITGEIDAEMLNQICQHVAFTDPLALSPDQVPADVVAREKAIFVEQAKESGKPENIVEKMVAGKVAKFMAENALLEQPFVRDEKKKIKEVLGSAKITQFVRFQIG
jgi:elongation factor Ts